MSLHSSLKQACHDILYKNMNYSDEPLYLLYDTESPLARELADAYIAVLGGVQEGELARDVKQQEDGLSSVLRAEMTQNLQGQKPQEIALFRREGQNEQSKDTPTSLPKIQIREFKNPPQPLYRGGLINPDNPHVQQQNRIATLHNIDENKRIGLDHHEKFEVKISAETSLVSDTGLHSQEGQVQKSVFAPQKGQEQGEKNPQSDQRDSQPLDPQIESIKCDLTSLPKGSIVILVQSANFRLSTFRIRLELFHRGIHVIEHNHLAYIKESEFATFSDCIQYRTPEYVRLQERFTELFDNADSTRIVSTDGSELFFGKTDLVRGNTADYSNVENKGGTFPVGEVLTEALDLSSVHGKCLIDTYPGDDFGIRVCPPFEMVVENGRVLPSADFPAEFAKIYDMIRDNENGEVLVRELGLGLNPAISTEHHLSDINFHERKVGLHLSIGKKHGLYGKKLPKTEVQRFHIDIFVALKEMYVGETKVFENGAWTV